MGAHVREPKKIPPPKTIWDICPHCSNKHRITNGAWLRWKRESVGLDQRTLAQSLGISGAYISDFERNRREVPEYVIDKYKGLK